MFHMELLPFLAIVPAIFFVWKVKSLLNRAKLDHPVVYNQTQTLAFYFNFNSLKRNSELSDIDISLLLQLRQKIFRFYLRAVILCIISFVSAIILMEWFL